MADKVLRSYNLDTDLLPGLKAASKGEYMPQSQVLRTALRTWLVDHGYLKKGGPRTRT